MRAKAWSQTVPRWRPGWEKRASYWSRWWERCVATSWPRRSYTPTTRRFRCWRRATARLKTGAKPWDLCARRSPGRRWSHLRRCGSRLHTRSQGRALPGALEHTFRGDAAAGGCVRHGYHPRFTRADGRVREAGCMAHVRRKFYDLQRLTKSPVGTGSSRTHCQTVRHRRRKSGGRLPEERREVRNLRSRPLLDALEAMAGRNSGASFRENPIRLSRFATLSGQWKVLEPSTVTMGILWR